MLTSKTSGSPIACNNDSRTAVDDAQLKGDNIWGTTPRLSITLLNYNYGRYLRDAISSILRQTFTDFELIVIDDKSTDDSISQIEPFLGDPRVRLVAHRENQGYCKSLIEGTEVHSRGEFLMVISADDFVVSEDAFQHQVSALQQAENSAFCFSAYDRIEDGSGNVIQHVNAYPSDRILAGDEFFRDYLTEQRVQVLHSGTMIRKSAYERAGGYRRDLNIALDFALWLVLALEGEVAYCNKTLYGYRCHPQQMSQSQQKVRRNVIECASAVECACARARQRALKVGRIRNKALQYILLAIAIDDAFSGRKRLAFARVKESLNVHPWLTLSSKGLWVIVARLLLGESIYNRMRRKAHLIEQGISAPALVYPRPAQSPHGDRLSVVLFINSIMMGGSEEHVRRLALGLRDRGADVSVVIPETTLVDPLAEALRAAELPFERITLSSMRGGGGVVSRTMLLARLLIKARPNVFHVHLIGYTGGWWAVASACMARVPKVICTMHNAPTDPQTRIVRTDCRVKARFIDRFIAVSGQNSLSLLQNLSIPSRKLVVIPNSVCIDAFNGDREPQRAVLRREFGISSCAPVIGAMARLEPQKGLTFLLQALPRILQKHPDARLLLVGDGSLRAELEAEARRLEVADYVHFVGFRQDAAAVLSVMDVAVLPSLHEGLPLSLLEAMAAGLPVVATRVGGMPEVVKDGLTGKIVPPRDPVALANAICSMLDCPETLPVWGAAARELAAEFSEAALLDRVLALYTETSDQRKR